MLRDVRLFIPVSYTRTLAAINVEITVNYTYINNTWDDIEVFFLLLHHVGYTG